MKNYYQILGVQNFCDEKEIKKSYRQLAIKYHPDKNIGDASNDSKFKEISDAYSILSDKQKRYDHDNELKTDLLQSSNAYPTIRVNPEDNLYIGIKVTLNEILFGTKRQIRVFRRVRCFECMGGTILIKDTVCKWCNGRILLNKEDVMTINIPKGVSNGQQLILPRNGHEPVGYGTPGNLIIIIDEQEHQHLKREGINLIYSLTISFLDAILGTELEVSALNKSIKIKINPGTQSGSMLRIKELGLPDINSFFKGDLIVDITVYIPRKLSIFEKNILLKLSKSKNLLPAKQ